MKDRDLIIICFVITALGSCNGFKCYTCTMHGGESDDACLKKPGAVTTSTPITTCNKKYCTIHRIQYISTGAIYSFSRDCEESPTSGVTTDSEFITYITKCTSTLCNGGDGKSSSGGNNSGGGGSSGGSGGSGSDSDNGPINGGDDSTLLIVPGIGGSAVRNAISYGLLLLVISAAVLL